jgi:hypothetical protein
MSALAAVVLAHSDAAQVNRLRRALEGADIYLHCDQRTPPEVFAEMTSAAAGPLTIVPRRATRWGQWSLVAAELAGLRAALATSQATHIAVLSGACYPLFRVDEIIDQLAATPSQSLMMLRPIPYEPWSSKYDDGGLWRFNRRYVQVRGWFPPLRERLLTWGRRPVPAGLQLRASSQWKIYARPHAQALLDALDGNRRLLAYWRGTVVPDESCAASILSTPSLVGDRSGELIDHLPWYLDFPVGARNPELLTMGHADALAAATAPADGARPKLFARKVSSQTTEVLDYLDALRMSRRPA